MSEWQDLQHLSMWGRSKGWFGPDIATRLRGKLDKFLGKPHLPLRGRILLFMDPLTLWVLILEFYRFGIYKTLWKSAFISSQCLSFAVTQCPMCHQSLSLSHDPSQCHSPVTLTIIMSPDLSRKSVWNLLVGVKFHRLKFLTNSRLTIENSPRSLFHYF